jgi:hypothetical protein
VSESGEVLGDALAIRSNLSTMLHAKLAAESVKIRQDCSAFWMMMGQNIELHGPLVVTAT